MKRFLLLAAAAIIGTSTIVPAQTVNWRRVNPSHNGHYQSISFPTPDTGFAVSTPNNFTDPETNFLRTTNGGDTWTVSKVQGVRATDVKFLTTKRGYAIGHDLSCSCGMIASSTDGGSNWAPVTFPDITSLNSIAFATPNIAVVSGTKSTILRSTDGGNNWTPIKIDATVEAGLGRIMFTSPTVGYMMGISTAVGVRYLVYKTTDAGLTWSKVLDGGPGTNGPTYQSMDFVSSEIGYVTGRHNGKAIYKTTDGGAHWTRIYDPQDGDAMTVLAGVDFMTEQLGYVCGSDGSIMKTVDGGQNWTQENSSTNNALSAFSFHDAENGLVAGLFGTLLKRNPPKPSAIVDNTELDFGEVMAEPKEMKLTISAGNSLGLRIESAMIVDPANGFSLAPSTGTFPKTITPNQPLEITVSYQPDISVEKLMESQLRIVTNDPVNTELEIPLKASQKKPAQPGASLNTTALDFGQVPSNRKKELTVTIQAANAAGLNITNMAVEGAGAASFRILEPAAAFPIVVQFGMPQVVRVEFAPAAEGQNYTGKLVIATNDAAKPAHEVTLNGRGSASVASVDNAGSAKGKLRVDCSPNPAMSETKLTVNLPQRAGRMTVALVNALGQLVKSLHDGPANAGSHTFPVDASTLANGFYYFTVHADGLVGMREMVVAR